MDSAARKACIIADYGNTSDPVRVIANRYGVSCPLVSKYAKQAGLGRRRGIKKAAGTFTVALPMERLKTLAQAARARRVSLNVVLNDLAQAACSDAHLLDNLLDDGVRTDAE